MKALQNLSADSFAVENWIFGENRIFLFASEKASPLLADAGQNPKRLGVVALLCKLGFPVKLFCHVELSCKGVVAVRRRRGGSESGL